MLNKESIMPESKFYHFSREGKPTRLTSAADALTQLKEEGFIWLDYCEPQKEELEALAEPLGLHPLSIEDCFDENQIPKIEDYPQHTFILFNAFEHTNGELAIREVDLFIGEKFLVTVSRCGADNQSLLNGAGRMVELDTASVREGPAFLAHVLLDHIVDRKFIAIEALEEELDKAEDSILEDHAHFNPGELVDLRRELLALRKSLFHEREILVKICRNDSLFISEKAILLYRDIYDHLAKFFELTESSRDLVTGLMEMYLSLINNQMTKAANDTNATVRRLTFITTIFMPLTLLAGIGGMSEYSMMTGPENWRIAYPAFLLAMVLLGIGSYYILKRIGKKDRE
jgi:magnesium transporter